MITNELCVEMFCYSTNKYEFFERFEKLKTVINAKSLISEGHKEESLGFTRWGRSYCPQ